ncbi:hypothetical protein BKA70DRAFT_1119954 [Coprinopsis sp. MPI-PUGE-AT-0042]|nr:hypothetical protein BKA70DRAFT_1119954 [Coprinopsis sp. MPI-PUGE-AT-0042]
MFSARPLVILFYLTLVVLASALSASINATIDHDDPSVTYSEGWEQVVVDEDSSRCTHMLSSHNPSAYALVKFRGTAFYVVSPKWPYRVAATISIDEGQPVHIDLQDHGIESEGQGPTTPANVVAYQGGLDPSVEHTLRIFTQPGEPFLVFHSLIYTSTADDSTPASASPSPATGPTSKPEAAAGISSPMAMTLGVAIGVGGSVILALSLLLLRKKTKKPTSSCSFH